MDGTVPEVRGLSVVWVGAFNPTIVSPDWFSRHELLRKSELEQARIEIVTPDFAKFQVDWLTVQITQNQFQVVTTTYERSHQLRDLASAILTLLPETPIRAMGVNNDMHFSIEDEAAWHKVGNTLTPKNIWQSTMKSPGMRSVTIEDERDDGYKGYVRVTVQPSVQITHGIYVQVNEHFQFSPNDSPLQSGDAKRGVELLNDSWESLMARSESFSAVVTGLTRAS